jgi:N4-gp56 family major capsid protein
MSNTVLSTNPGISQRTEIFAAQEMLEKTLPVIVLDKFGVTRPMPKNKGVNIKFRRVRVFDASVTPLQEGVTPSSTAFRYEDVSGTLKQYGQVVTVTDVIEDTHEDPVLKDASQECGDNIGRTMEALNWGVLRAGTSVFYSNGTARTDVNTPITLNKLRAVVKSLKAQKAKMITKILSASVDYGTRAVEAAYVAVCHTDLEPDIRNLAGFLPTSEYGTRKTVHENEFGTVENIRFVTSPDLDPIADAGAAYAGSGTAMVTTSGTSADVYPILVFGENAYGMVPLRGMGSVEPSIIPVGQKTKDDPLGQRGYVGWKAWHLCLILNQTWMTRIECAVTDID